jgi:ATP-dependent RNA helicase DeaD
MSGTFTSLGLAPVLVEALTALGYEQPTPIQLEAIPPLLAGRDLLGQAATGTGKTAAFALPLLQRIPTDAPATAKPSLLVLVPTRELAIQVAKAFERYGAALGTKVVPIYGGQPFDGQIRLLRRGVHVVVATPGRALDHINRKTLDLSGLTAIVLDEADEMLDMGFADELDAILAAVPTERQTALFSATLAPRIAAIAERHLKDPVRVAIAREQTAAGEAPRVRQVAHVVSHKQKVGALARVLDFEQPALAVIFCRTRGDVDTLSETLAARGYRAEALHGGMTQEQRDRVMKRTRGGAVDLLIATDVAARGLDIEQISHVINFDVPKQPAVYVHRIGRTGRAGREGVAVSLVEPSERGQIRNIEAVMRQQVRMVPLPSIEEVRARRLEATSATVRAALMAGDLDSYRAVVATLAEEYPLADIAAAAVKLIHMAGAGARGDADEAMPLEALHPTPSRERPERERATAGRSASSREESGEPEERPARSSKAPGARKGVRLGRIFVGAGKRNNMRPADLVGAIVNEAGVLAADIGTIEITDKFALVELPDGLVDQVVAALRVATVKGKRLTVRRDLAKRK